MLIADVPQAPVQDAPVAAVYETDMRRNALRLLRPMRAVREPVTLAAASTSNSKLAYGVCAFAPPGTRGFTTELNPSRHMNDFLPKEFRNRLKLNDLTQEEWEWYGTWSQSFSVKVLRAPQHGKMVGSSIDRYLPDDGFIGRDRVELLVEGSDKNSRSISLKLIYFINAVSDAEFNEIVRNYSQSLSKYCGTTKEYWRISWSMNGTASLSAWLSSTHLDAALVDASNVTFADLPGSAIAQATGQAITFDSNAAGQGWFIDLTPGLNEEFMPTSNPYEWKARLDSEAAGKINLLSALRHEYGHALGIEHSPGSCFMTVPLQPDVRRAGHGSGSPAFDSLKIPAPVPQFEAMASPGPSDLPKRGTSEKPVTGDQT